MQLTKLKVVITLAFLLLASGCTHTVIKPSPLPLPICPDLVQIHPDEIAVKDDYIIMHKQTMVKIVKRDAQRKACKDMHRAVIESTHNVE